MFPSRFKYLQVIFCKSFFTKTKTNFTLFTETVSGFQCKMKIRCHTHLLAVLWRASFGAVMPDSAITFSGGGPPWGCLLITTVSPDNTCNIHPHQLLLKPRCIVALALPCWDQTISLTFRYGIQRDLLAKSKSTD